MTRLIRLAIACVFAIAPLGIDAALASELTIGRAVSASTMDPGFLREPATLVDNVFDTLVARDNDMHLAPGLALSWKALDDTTWEFKLRPDVHFQDGEPFTAATVKFSIDRVLDPAAHAPTISYINTIASVEAANTASRRACSEALPSNSSCTREAMLLKPWLSSPTGV